VNADFDCSAYAESESNRAGKPHLRQTKERLPMSALQPNLASVPPGVRIYAVGDIHGRLDLLEPLLEMIMAHDENASPACPVLIFMGDYIDRGPDSRGVIDLLVSGLPDQFEQVFLRGNHEDMMLRIFKQPDQFDVWAMNGGLATARSYGVEFNPHNFSETDAKFIISRLDIAVPLAHRKFLEGLRINVTLGDYFFVHAGVRPGIPLDQQKESDCLFIRNDFLSYAGGFGKVIVHGHTPMAEPEDLPNRINVDTGAFFTDQLTALCLEGTSRKFATTGRGWYW
jgi:serine/threonine protein phosphatase 1